MKKTIILFCLLIAAACAKKQETVEEVTVVKDTIVKDSVQKSPATANDSDSHGCETSAGYFWSALLQKCVHVSEEGTKLSPYDSQNQSTGSNAFVIFEKNGNKAELFLPNGKVAIILERKSEGDQYVNGNWQLIPWKGYVLKNGNEILFIGK